LKSMMQQTILYDSLLEYCKTKDRIIQRKDKKIVNCRVNSFSVIDIIYDTIWYDI
jgi:hypothetical protein